MKKWCPDCSQYLLEEKFGKHCRSHDGLQHSCKQCRKVKDHKYYIKNNQDIKLRNSIYEKQYLPTRLKNQKSRRKKDICFRLKQNLRSRLVGVLKGNIKMGSTIKDLGCSSKQLKIHLENQFESGMSWDNYGKKPGQWSIDHIIALSTVDLTDREQFLKVNHYTNLRPMWHCGLSGNISKGAANG